MNKFIVIEKRKHIMLISSWYPSRLDPFNGDFVQRHAIAISQLNKVSVVHVEGVSNINNWELVTNRINEEMTEYIYYFPKSKIPLINFINKIRGLSQGKRSIGDIDLIHANVVHYHFIWLLFQSLPYIITEHATQYHRFQSFTNAWLKKLIFKPIFQHAKRILPVSKHLGDKLEEIFGVLSIEVVPNVINTDLFYPKENKSSVFTFLHLSNLSVAKNIPGILEAILQLKQKGYSFLFQLGGNGDSSQIVDFINKHQLSNFIQLVPPLSHSEVAENMRNADCFVLFSDFENQPCVLAEALASGLPFISTNIGGVSEFIPSAGTWLIDKGNIPQLTDTMEILVSQRPKIDRGELVNFAAKTFAANYISQKINKIYNDCLISSN